MTDINNTGDQNTILDNDFTVSSESGSGKVLVVDGYIDKVGINHVPTTGSPDFTVIGNTGITGTTDITESLTVSTDVLIASSTLNKVGINHTPTVGSDELTVTGSISGTEKLTIQTTRFLVDSSGRVGINTTPTSSTALTVSSTPSYGTAISAAGNVDISKSLTVASDQLVVSDSQSKVGINHTPAAGSSDFTVEGSTNLDGDVELGSSNSDAININGTMTIAPGVQGAGIIPIGGVIPVMDNLSGSYSLPASGAVQDGWMLCDGSPVPSGQTISDTESTPKLDDDRFLQGSSVAGATGGHNSLSTGSGDISVQSRTISWQSTNLNTSGETASWNNDSIHLGAFVDKDQLNGGRQNNHSGHSMTHDHGLGGHVHYFPHGHMWGDIDLDPSNASNVVLMALNNAGPNTSEVDTASPGPVIAGSRNDNQGDGNDFTVGFQLNRDSGALGTGSSGFLYTAGPVDGLGSFDEKTSGPEEHDGTGPSSRSTVGGDKASWNSDIPISGDSFNKSDLNSDQFNHDHHFNKNELNSDQNDHDHDVDINDSRPKFLTCKYLIRVS